MSTQQWYVACTAMQQELKAARWLMKKGMESYCPVMSRIDPKGKINSSPLFQNLVFVYSNPGGIAAIVKRPLIVSMYYWMADPVVVTDDEIGAIRQVTSGYSRIELQKIPVNPGGGLIVESQYNNQHQSDSSGFHHPAVNILLPSLGYQIKATGYKNEIETPEKNRLGGFWLQRNLSSLGQFRIF